MRGAICVYRALTSVMITLWSTPSVFAAPVVLSQVLSSVDAHYPLVAAAVQDVEKAKGILTAARGGFDTLFKSTYQGVSSGEYKNRYFDSVVEQPTTLWGTRFYTGYRKGTGSFGAYEENLLTSRDGELRVGIGIPILRGGDTDERRAKIETGERGVDASQAHLELQRLEARRQASHRFYDWLATGEKLRIARMLLQLAIKRDQMMAQRVQQGDAAKIEQTDNQRSVAQREAAQIAAQRALEKAALELALFYRDSNGDPIIPSADQLPTDTLIVPNENESRRMEKKLEKALERGSTFLTEMVSRHPELLRLRAQIDLNEVDRRLAKNTILPKLDAELMAAQDRDTTERKNSDLEYKASLKLEFPLLLRSGRGEFEAASAQSLKLGRQLDLARDRIRVILKDSLQAMSAARSRIRITREEIDLSLKVEEAERLKFRQGDSNILTINLRENSTADARIRAVDALVDYYRARIEFEAASAGTWAFQNQ